MRETLLEYQQKFNNSKIKSSNIGKNLSDIIGYYRGDETFVERIFSRKDLSDDELIDDRECIGNMKLTSNISR